MYWNRGFGLGGCGPRPGFGGAAIGCGFGPFARPWGGFPGYLPPWAGPVGNLCAPPYNYGTPPWATWMGSSWGCGHPRAIFGSDACCEQCREEDEAKARTAPPSAGSGTIGCADGPLPGAQARTTEWSLGPGESVPPQFGQTLLLRDLVRPFRPLYPVGPDPRTPAPDGVIPFAESRSLKKYKNVCGHALDVFATPSLNAPIIGQIPSSQDVWISDPDYLLASSQQGFVRIRTFHSTSLMPNEGYIFAPPGAANCLQRVEDVTIPLSPPAVVIQNAQMQPQQVSAEVAPVPQNAFPGQVRSPFMTTLQRIMRNNMISGVR